MKIYLSTLILIISLSQAKSQTKVTAKEVVNYVGKEVTLCYSVYSARAMENVSLLNSSGASVRLGLSITKHKHRYTYACARKNA